MTWLRFNQGYTRSGKIAPLSDAAFRLWHELLDYSNENLTDGYVSDKALPSIPSLRNATESSRAMLIAELIDAKVIRDGLGLLEKTIGGHFVHDFLNYQLSRKQVLARRKKEREKKEAQRERMRTLRNDRARASSTAGNPSSTNGAAAHEAPATNGHAASTNGAHGGRGAVLSPGGHPEGLPEAQSRTKRARVRTSPATVTPIASRARIAKG
jgi:hypothetical protein